MTDQSSDAGTFDVRTPVYGIFECGKCAARRPIFVPRVEYWRKGGGGDRTYRCRVCGTKTNVTWLDRPVTFQSYLDDPSKMES
jgi:hypothetical protein